MLRNSACLLDGFLKFSQRRAQPSPKPQIYFFILQKGLMYCFAKLFGAYLLGGPLLIFRIASPGEVGEGKLFGLRGRT